MTPGPEGPAGPLPPVPQREPGDLEGYFCDACGRDANDVADEDFFLPTGEAQRLGYLSGRCQRHPPEDPQHFERVHVGGKAAELEF